jgi:hypothetical protein
VCTFLANVQEEPRAQQMRANPCEPQCGYAGKRTELTSCDSPAAYLVHWLMHNCGMHNCKGATHQHLRTSNCVWFCTATVVLCFLYAFTAAPQAAADASGVKLISWPSFCFDGLGGQDDSKAEPACNKPGIYNASGLVLDAGSMVRHLQP